jgi:hypothetical protein
MLTKNDFRNMISKSAAQARPCRLTAKFVRPVFGRFVELADAKDLAAKGWYRFVINAKEDAFQANPKAELTKMYNIDSIIFIDFYNN